MVMELTLPEGAALLRPVPTTIFRVEEAVPSDTPENVYEEALVASTAGAVNVIVTAGFTPLIIIEPVNIMTTL